MEITLDHTGFHGEHVISIYGTPQPQPDPHQAGTHRVTISPRVADRISRILCGISDCLCGEGAHEVDRGIYVIDYTSDDCGRTGTWRGRYAR